MPKNSKDKVENNIGKEKSKKIKQEKDITKNNSKLVNKNFLIIIFVIFAIIILILYITKWQNIKNKEKIMNSYLISNKTTNLEIKSLEEVNQILTEVPTEYFVLISYTNNIDTYELEKNLKPIIDKYKLNDSFYYFNAKNLMSEENYIQKLNETFKTTKIKKIPVILYYKNNQLVDLAKRDDNNLLNAGDFQKLLDIYEIKEQ